MKLIWLGRFVSGGPMILQKDGVQYGVYKGHFMFYQIFMKMSFFFDWISDITGMDLPEC